MPDAAQRTRPRPPTRANTGEALSGRLRPGNAGANTATDHIAVFDQALAQIPDAHRHGNDILVRTDSAGSAKAFLAHVRDMRKRGIRTFFSVGYAITEPVRRAIRAMPEHLGPGLPHASDLARPRFVGRRPVRLLCAFPRL